MRLAYCSGRHDDAGDEEQTVMADVPDQTGEGTLYDTDDNELATVAYVVRPISTPMSDSGEWGGELEFPDSTVNVEPGRYVLSLSDGTLVDIDIAPLGSADGDPRRVEFTGVGTFGRQIL
jgi:hypothetical protein